MLTPGCRVKVIRSPYSGISKGDTGVVEGLQNGSNHHWVVVMDKDGFDGIFYTMDVIVIPNGLDRVLDEI